MTRALELLFGFQPVRRATQVRAYGGQRIDAWSFTPFIKGSTDQPYCETLFEPFIDLTGLNLVWKTRFESWRWLKKDIRKHESRGRG